MIKKIAEKKEHRQVRFRRKQIRTRRTFGRCADCGRRSERYRCAACREKQREKQRLLMRARLGIVASSPEPMVRKRLPGSISKTDWHKKSAKLEKPSAKTCFVANVP